MLANLFFGLLPIRCCFPVVSLLDRCSSHSLPPPEARTKLRKASTAVAAACVSPRWGASRCAEGSARGCGPIFPKRTQVGHRRPRFTDRYIVRVCLSFRPAFDVLSFYESLNVRNGSRHDKFSQRMSGWNVWTRLSSICVDIVFFFVLVVGPLFLVIAISLVVISFARL